VNVCTFADLVVVEKRPTSDGQSKISRVFNFAILGYSRKLDAREYLVFYSMSLI